MEKIEHKYVDINGLKLHVAEIGAESSPAVVFLHGFPAIWYSWRHQMIAVAEADYRGYGLSDPPPQPDKARFLDLVDDLLALLDALSLSKVCADEIRLASILFSFFPPNRLHSAG